MKQICNHPYQYLKTGDISKDVSGKADKLVSITKQILENNEIKQSSGSSIPHKFVVEKIDGKFVVTNVRIPRDGLYYADDIKDIFPTSVRYNMDKIHTDGTIDELELEVKQKAEDYFEKIK